MELNTSKFQSHNRCIIYTKTISGLGEWILLRKLVLLLLEHLAVLKNGIRDACSSAEIFLHFYPLNQDQSTLRGKLILVQIVVFLSLDNPELHRDTFHLVLHLVLRYW